MIPRWEGRREREGGREGEKEGGREGEKEGGREGREEEKGGKKGKKGRREIEQSFVLARALASTFESPHRPTPPPPPPRTSG